MQYDSRDRLIIAQVAVKAAVELSLADDTINLGATAVEIQDTIFALAEAPHGATSVQQPLATVIEHPSLANVPAPIAEAFTTPSGQAPIDMSQVPAAQPIGAESPAEVLWADALFHNPGDWFNNVGSEKAKTGGGTGPDFKHRRITKGKYNLGLWVDSKETPAFVSAKLGR